MLEKALKNNSPTKRAKVSSGRQPDNL